MSWTLLPEGSMNSVPRSILRLSNAHTRLLADTSLFITDSRLCYSVTLCSESPLGRPRWESQGLTGTSTHSAQCPVIPLEASRGHLLGWLIISQSPISSQLSLMSFRSGLQGGTRTSILPLGSLEATLNTRNTSPRKPHMQSHPQGSSPSCVYPR